jgi:hypothetical protein
VVEGLVPAIKPEDYLANSRQRRTIKPKRFDDYVNTNIVENYLNYKCIFCICMNRLKIPIVPILTLIQREREHLLMVSESRFEALNYIFLQVVPL